MPELSNDPEYVKLFTNLKTASPEERLAYYQIMADKICDAAGIEHVEVKVGRVSEGAGAEQITMLIGDDFIRIPESLLSSGKTTINEMPHEMVHILQNDLSRKVLAGDIGPGDPGYILGRAYITQMTGQEAGLMSAGFGIDYLSRTTEEHAYLEGPKFETALYDAMFSNPQISQNMSGVTVYGTPMKYGIAEVTRDRLKAEGNPNIDHQNVPAILEAMGPNANKPYTEANFDQLDEYKRQRLEKVSATYSGDFDYIKENLSGLSEKKFAAMLKDGQLSQSEIAVLKAHIKPEATENSYVAESIDSFAKFINEGVTPNDGQTLFQELKALKVEMYMPDTMKEAFEQSPPLTPNPLGTSSKLNR
ncbi:MAG: hypothetical protein U1E36_09825 [Rickettsiales bacterium]